MMFLWAACGIPFAIYFILTKALIPVQVQPEVFSVFCLISWFQSLYYPPCNYSAKRSLLIVSLLLVLSAGLQGGLIYYYRSRGIEDPTDGRLLVFGIIASILLAIGLIPPYFELAKRKGQLVGFSFLFLAVDCSGAIFSMFSVVFGEKLDIMGITLYVICAALEIGLFVSHFIWCLRFKWFKKDTKDEEAGTSSNNEITEDHGMSINVSVKNEEKS